VLLRMKTVGSSPDEKSFYDVANKRDGYNYSVVFEVKKEIPESSAQQISPSFTSPDTAWIGNLYQHKPVLHLC